MRKTLVLLSSAAAVAWTSPLLAQGSGPASAPSQPAAASKDDTPQDQATPPGETQDSGAIQDIVVTAERHSTTVQKSSVSIEVFSGQQLEGVTKPQDLTKLSPGIVVANRGSAAQVFIRGVGDTAAANIGTGAVPFNIDNVYYARYTSVGPSMFDIERIEVLKGPQGTLYGRNASGGAVNILTTRPRLGRLSGYAAGDVGNYGLHHEEAGINVPLGSEAALRVSGQMTDRHGFLSNGLNDEHTKSLRARLLIEPNDTFSVLINGDISHLGGHGGGFAVYPVAGGNPWRGITQAPLLWTFLFNPNTAPLTQPNDSQVDSNNRGISAEVNADLGFATLTFIPAYRYQDHLGVQYSTNLRFAEHSITKETTGELRLGHESDVLKWVVGAYYYDENADIPATITAGSLSGNIIIIHRKAYAGFGQATYSVSDRLRLIAGGRYTSEHITGSFESAKGAIGNPATPFVPIPPITPVTPTTDKRLNFKLGAEYDLAPSSMLYLTYATGFKAGGFNGTNSCGSTSYKPEDLRALTAGIRNRFMDNRLQINGEAFYWQYKNQQVTVVTLDPCGSPAQLITNPGDATIKGANVDVVFKATPADTLRGSVEYNDATYDRYQYRQVGLGIYNPALGTRCSSAAAPTAGSFDINCAGQQLARTPKWSGTAGYQHVFDISSNQLIFNADAQFASARWLDLSYIPNGRVKGYAQLNAQLTFVPSSERWSLSAYINNITDEAIYTGGNAVASAPSPDGNRYFAAAIQPPRTYGVRLRVKIGE